MSGHRDLGPRYLIEGTSTSAANQLRSYGIGLALGLAAVGYIQAASTLMGPVTVLFLGMSLVTIPEGARVLRRSPRHLPLFCLAVGGGLAAATIAWGCILLVAVPRGLGAWLLGPIWRPTYPLILPTMISVAGSSACAGASAGLHALGAARRSVRVTLSIGPIFIGCAVAGAPWRGHRDHARERGIGVGGCGYVLVGTARRYARVRTSTRRSSILVGAAWSAAPQGFLRPALAAQERNKESNVTEFDRAKTGAHAATGAPRIGLFGLLGQGNLGNDGSLEAVLATSGRASWSGDLDFLCSGPDQVTARYGIPAARLRWYDP